MIANTSRVRFVAAVLLALGVALASALAYAPVVLAQKIDTTPPADQAPPFRGPARGYGRARRRPTVYAVDIISSEKRSTFECRLDKNGNTGTWGACDFSAIPANTEPAQVQSLQAFVGEVPPGLLRPERQGHRRCGQHRRDAGHLRLHRQRRRRGQPKLKASRHHSAHRRGSDGHREA
jgi:hypothetical protein